MTVLEEGLRRRLYLNEVAGRGPGPRRRGDEVAGRGPGPRRRGGAVVAQRRTREAGRRLTNRCNLKPNSPSLNLGLYNAIQTDS